MLTKKTNKKNINHNKMPKMHINRKNGVKMPNCKGAGCRACGSPFYPDCIDSCPLFDN